MRRAGTIAEEQQARRLADFLLTQGIETRIDPNSDGCAVWIIDERHLEQGREELERFVDNPTDARYDGAARAAESIRKETAQKHRQAKKNIIEVRSRWQRPLAQRAPVTFALMAVSIGVFIFEWISGDDGGVYRLLTIDSHVVRDMFTAPAFGLMDIKNGQVWRLITPIFLHADIIHILFNMWMTHFFGTQIESRQKLWQMALLVLVIAVSSNLGEYFVSGPAFRGMSGVVYGMFGFVWMKARTNPFSGYYLNRSTVVILVGWFFLCLSGITRLPIANTAHGVGLAVGMLIGAAPYLWTKAFPPGK